MALTPINQELLQTYSVARKHHQEVCTLRNHVEAACRSMDGGTIVDATYVLKRTSELADETRKEIDRTLVLVQKLGCLAVMHTTDDKLHGQIANGYGKSGQELIVPDKDKNPNEYLALMRAIGVTEEMAANPYIKPSWKDVAEFTSKLAEEGKPIPPGLEHVQHTTKFTVVATAKRGSDIDEVAPTVALSESTLAQASPPANAIHELVAKLANRIMSKSDVQQKLTDHFRPNGVVYNADDIPF